MSTECLSGGCSVTLEQERRYNQLVQRPGQQQQQLLLLVVMVIAAAV
jgi:hypothetical protein